MSTTALPSAAPTITAVKPRRAPLAVLISAWAVPIMVVGGFAFLAYIPLAVVVIGVLFDPRSRRALGWWTAPLALAWFVPFGIWQSRPDPAESMSKDISPLFIGLVVLAAVALLGRIYTRRKS